MADTISTDFYTTDIPRQKLKKSEKTDKWARDTIDAIISTSRFDSGRYGGDSNFDIVLAAYEYYNGIINDDDYNHVLKPYGKTRGNFPTKLQNYNIIKPIIDLLVGEFQKRPFNWSVTVSNPDVVTNKEKQRVAILEANLKQHFINELNNRGMETGVPSQEVPRPEEVLEEFERSYKDYRVILTENAIQFILRHQEMFEKFEEGFFHFLISGMVFTERYIENNEPKYRILNPLDVDYDKSPDTKYVEDGTSAVVRIPSQVSDIIDAYYEELTPEQIDTLENPIGQYEYLFYSGSGSSRNSMNRNDDSTSRLLEVYKVYWKSMKRIGILTYIDEDGVPNEDVVEDGYSVDKESGESVEWYWVNEEWQGTRIGTKEQAIYLRVGPVENTRGNLDNISSCKLSINGRKYSDINAHNISLVMLGIPYQISYNIYQYRLDLAVAKAKGMIANIDINSIPSQGGMDIDKWLHYIDATGFAFVDYSKEGVQVNPTHQTSIDLTVKEIESYIALLSFTLESWDRLHGVTRQRRGAVSEYDAVGVTEAGIVQSSHITEDYFTKFARLQQRDLQAIGDISRLAWVNGKKAQYVMPDFTTAYLDVDGVEYSNIEFGVFVESTAKDKQKIEALRQLAQPLIQNGAPISTVADLFQSDNFVILKEKIMQTEKKIQELAQKQAQAQQQAEAEMRQAEMEIERERMANDNQQKELDRQNKIDVALIQAQSNEDDETTDVKRDEISRKYRLEDKKLDLDRDKHRDDIRMREKEISIKKSSLNGKSNGKSK